MAGSACNDGGNRHAPIAASHHLGALTSVTSSDGSDGVVSPRKTQRCFLVQNGAKRWPNPKTPPFFRIPSRLMSILDSQPFLAQKPWKFWPRQVTLGSPTRKDSLLRYVYIYIYTIIFIYVSNYMCMELQYKLDIFSYPATRPCCLAITQARATTDNHSDSSKQNPWTLIFQGRCIYVSVVYIYIYYVLCII